MKRLKLSVMMAVLVVMLAACSSANNTAGTDGNANAAAEATDTPQATTVEITDAHGTVTVPVNPKNVVALDNRTFETLASWDIELAAVPKGVMPADSPYVADENVQDIGNHSEPKLEIIAAVEPELVIVGQRFSGFYEDIKKLVPNAAVIDLTFDVSEEAGAPGENLVNGLKQATTTLGQIFDKNDEAKQLTADFDQAIEKAKSAYNGTDKVMSIIVSGGDIGFSAPHSGRVWGPLYDILGWTPALEVAESSTNHQGDEISVEAIAQSNPDWLLVLDRDAAINSTEEKVPAQDVIDNSPALQNTTAVTAGKIVYAPNDTYTNESLQTFIEVFNNIAEAFAK
ncbi:MULTISPECIES: siderophore ABC transporter substrate-binding protein [unclassified Paenibacillus]|uniref:siderophore ABC transporter substrate-binding protein n=1 Tax=unclassified Paenibacillus TaxID=185978 RepID=UPI002406520E|nr:MULTISPECIES: siderophore ABC transporter substrate-binding protein [unclassified Paenibacillus]MDF9843766.1 iron complex transport system substrate-binding protein [Paenibacillus sp. PastF-2]MDF9850395.1 iron complex transport system substrate-binding protein [Paenibacillus sp. PastM-2]MDF9856902.1 iron complex transport system substrate-binding protein [Paenibacillus sp. PastF-1]MDH6482241.1 iron complex transport system substrate-binding protein [Paenibacillus sp. PastH-2]MDH6509595.1 ir